MGPVNKFVSTSKKIFSRQQSSILSAAGVITIASLLSAVLGFLRDRLLISRFYSVVEDLDAYWVAFRLPELTFQLLVIGAISAAFIPVFSKYYKRNKEEAYHIANGMLNLVLGLFVLVSIIIFIFAREFNSLITSVNFTSDQVALAANLSRVMILAQFFFAISNFMTGIIQANHRFLIPALAPLTYNLGIIFGIVTLTPTMGIYAPAVGVVIGALLHLLLQLPLAYSLGFRYEFVYRFTHPGIREMIRLMPPRTMAILVNQIELFSSVYFATALSAGSLTIINIAQRLMSAPIRVFSVPIAQASLPFLSKEVAEGKMKEFRDTLITSLHQIIFLTIPAAVLLLILRIPLVRIVYGAPEFPWSATLLTGKVVAILTISLVAQGGVHILVRAFYAIHNTRIPFVMALISVVITIAGSYASVFIFDWGVLGLAGAMSLSALSHFVLLFVSLIRQIGPVDWSELLMTPLKVTVASAAMGIFLWGPMRLLDQFVFDTTRVVPLITLTISVCISGGIMYLMMAKALQIRELPMFVHLARRLGNWQKALTDSEEVIESTSQSQEVKPL